MGSEIERKFLLSHTGSRPSGEGILYRQGYLSVDSERSARVRIAGNQAWLTIKGKSESMTRREFEYPIPLHDAQDLLDHLCLKPLIEKKRYRIDVEGTCWEVDEFLGENSGLILAEVELKHQEQVIVLPDWIGEEVTDDPRYYNAALVNAPYSSW
ncbi:MAG: adenylate cyclase [Zetaproteobacteria bacterium CG_4_9_14_3_um_filter_53_7]|nr:MAG: adenylate cyclase [Zetaproteobacteria bacterium CG_4_9_14_3_um_filter_53_7]